MMTQVNQEIDDFKLGCCYQFEFWGLRTKQSLDARAVVVAEKVSTLSEVLEVLEQINNDSLEPLFDIHIFNGTAIPPQNLPANQQPVSYIFDSYGQITSQNCNDCCEMLEIEEITATIIFIVYDTVISLNQPQGFWYLDDVSLTTV